MQCGPRRVQGQREDTNVRNLSLRLAIAVVTLYAAATAFVVVKAMDEATLPGSVRLVVTGSETTTGGIGLPALQDAVATEAQAVVVRQVNDLYDRSVRHLFVSQGTTGQKEARWLADGYPGFSQAVSNVVHPSEELSAVDPRGVYFVFGEPTVEAIVAARFRELGYDVEVSSTALTLGTGTTYVFQILGGPTFAVFLLTALLIAIGAASGTKKYATLRLHGLRESAAVWRDLRELRTSAALVISATGVASGVGLWAYNGLHQADRFLRLFGVVLLAGLAVVLVVHILTVHLVWGGRVLDGIKGRLSVRVAAPVAYLVRAPGLILAVTLLATSSAAAGSAADAAGARDDLALAGSAAKVHFEGQVSPDDMDRLAADSGAWLKGEAAAGRALLVLPLAHDDGSGPAPDVLVVNDAYLERNPVLDSAGERVLHGPPASVLLLVPDGAPDTAQKAETLIKQLSVGVAAPEFEVRAIRAASPTSCTSQSPTRSSPPGHRMSWSPSYNPGPV